MTKYIKFPFASVESNRTEIPDTTQSDGSVSYQTGFGIDYQKKLGQDANAKPMPRQGTNGLFYDITSALQQYQQNGFFPFITSDMNDGNPFPYSIGATVIYDISENQDGSDIQLFTSKKDTNTGNPKDNPKDWVSVTPPLMTEEELAEGESIEARAVSAELLSKSTAGRLLNIIKFEESDTYTPSNGTSFIIVEAVGGGGAGGGAQASSTSIISIGSGGGGGGYCKSKITKDTLGSKVDIIIGAGGLGVSGATGGKGGDTLFGTFLTAGGGGGGIRTNTNGSPIFSSGADGGVANNGNIINTNGGVSGVGFVISSAAERSGDGGTSFLSKEAGTGSTLNKAGYNATGYGCAGGGANMISSTGYYKGGDGYQGMVIIWEYA